jgi:hypothetical protein
MQRIYSLAHELLASQGLCSVELVRKLVLINPIFSGW